MARPPRCVGSVLSHVAGSRSASHVMFLIVRTALVMGARMMSRIIGGLLCHPFYGLLVNHRATAAATAAAAQQEEQLVPTVEPQGTVRPLRSDVLLCADERF